MAIDCVCRNRSGQERVRGAQGGRARQVGPGTAEGGARQTVRAGRGAATLAKPLGCFLARFRLPLAPGAAGHPIHPPARPNPNPPRWLALKTPPASASTTTPAGAEFSDRAAGASG